MTRGEPIAILLVEDEPAHTEAIRRALEASGMTVDIQVVGTLREYRERVTVQTPDIALMDLNLPDGRAVDVLTAPPEAGPFPILIMTSYGTERIAVEAMKAGALDYIVKSSESFTAISRTVERALREWKLLTERKQAEEALRASREYLDNIINAIADPVFVKDDRHHLVLVNDAECSLAGVPRGEILGKTDYSFFPKEQVDAFWRVDDHVIATGEESINEETITDARTGGIRTIVTRKTRYVDAAGNRFIVGVIRDITELKQAENVIRDATLELEKRVAERTAQLQAANKELESFSFTVSHDLRAPVRAIDGFAAILKDEYASALGTEGNRLLGIIRDNTKKMDALIKDLLSLSLLTRGEIRRARIDMTAMAEAVYRELASPEEQRSIEFSIVPLPEAFGDPTLIRQVWSNLLANAIKYGRPKKERAITVGGRAGKGAAVYFIRDTGVGFDPTYANKLFGVFQRLHRADEFEGTGVGLAIVKRIIQRHGGEVWAAGKPGEGAEFSFSLPTRKEVGGEST